MKQSLNPELNEWPFDKVYTAHDLGLSDSRNLWVHTKLNLKDQQLFTGGEANKMQMVEGNTLQRKTVKM